MRKAGKATAVALLVCGAGLSVLAGCGRSDKVTSVAPQTEPAGSEQAQGDEPLAERERALAEREAELDAREAELARQQGKPVARATPVAPTSAAPAPPAAPAIPALPTPVPASPTPAPIPVTLASGTLVTVEFQQKLSSHESTEGQSFSVRVAEPVRVPEGVAIPTGSVVSGRVTEAKPAKKIGGSSRLAVEFVSIRLPSGETLPFFAAFSSKGKSSTGKDVGIIAGAAAGGAIIGNQVFDDDGGAKGALIGAAAGAIVASQTKAKPVEIAAGTVTNLELTAPISLKIRP
jgi:Glycine zipper 2TM domain